MTCLVQAQPRKRCPPHTLQGSKQKVMEMNGEGNARERKQLQKRAAPSSQCAQRGPPARDWSAGSTRGMITAARVMWCMGCAYSSMQDHCRPHRQAAYRSAREAPASLALGSGTTRRKSTLIRKLKAPHICRNKCKITLMTTDIQHSESAPQHCMLSALPDKCQKCPPVH